MSSEHDRAIRRLNASPPRRMHIPKPIRFVPLGNEGDHGSNIRPGVGSGFWAGVAIALGASSVCWIAFYLLVFS